MMTPESVKHYMRGLDMDVTKKDYVASHHGHAILATWLPNDFLIALVFCVIYLKNKQTNKQKLNNF